MKKRVENVNITTASVQKQDNLQTQQAEYKNFSAVLKPPKQSLAFANPKTKNKKYKKPNNNIGYLHQNPDNQNALLIDNTTSLKQAGRVVASIKQRQIDSYDELENYKKLLKKRKRRLIARIFTFLLLLIVAPSMIFIGTIIIDKNSRHDFFGFNFYIIATESMEPEIMVDDCVVLSKVSDVYSLKIGDDIGYINDQGDIVVHRIEKIIETASGSLEFETGGINNLSNDQKRVGFEQIVGKRIATLRTLGNAIVFFRSIPGIILFFTIFAGVMLAFYVAFRLSENIKYIENVE